MVFKKGHKKIGGKKKGAKNKTTLKKEMLLNYLTQKIVNGKGKWVTALIKGMNKGDVRAIKEGLDRVLGKAQERLDITSGDKPLPILNVSKNNSDKKDTETD